jgi:hypothetical protein
LAERLVQFFRNDRARIATGVKLAMSAEKIQPS